MSTYARVFIVSSRRHPQSPSPSRDIAERLGSLALVLGAETPAAGVRRGALADTRRFPRNRGALAPKKVAEAKKKTYGTY